MTRCLSRGWVAWVAITLLSTGPAARADDTHAAAKQRFDTLAAEAKARDDMPRATDPEVSVLLDTLGDTARIEALARAPEPLRPLLETCGESTTVLMAYALFDAQRRAGAGLGADTGPEELARRMREVLDANAIRFQDEMARLQPLLIRCAGLQSPLLSSFLAGLPAEQRTPVRLQGARQFQNGAASLVFGVLTVVSDPRLKLAYRTQYVAALAGSIGPIAQLLPVAARAQLLVVKRTATAEAPAEMKAALEAIDAALSDERCEGLCALAAP